MTKAGCERDIRQFCHQWKRTYHNGIPNEYLQSLNSELGYNEPIQSSYGSVHCCPPIDVAEMWFD